VESEGAADEAVMTTVYIERRRKKSPKILRFVLKIMFHEGKFYLKAADHGEVLVDILVVFQLVHIDLVRAHAPYKIDHRTAPSS
jgi:hypothetical protein